MANTFLVSEEEMLSKTVLFNHTKQNQTFFTHFTTINVNLSSKNCYFLEIFNNNYYLTQFDKNSTNLSLKNKSAHLSLNDDFNIFDNGFVKPKLQDVGIDKNKCLCLQLFDDKILTECMGQTDTKNLELMLRSIGVYDKYKKVLLFLSRVKSLLFDIETINNYHSNETKTKIERKPFSSVNDDNRTKILSHFSTLLIGGVFHINLKSVFSTISKFLGKNFLWYYKSRFFYTKLEKALKKMTKTKHEELVDSIISKKYEPHKKIFYNMHDFFSHILFWSRLSEIIHIILLHPLLESLKPYHKTKGIYSMTERQLYQWCRKTYVWAYNSSKFDSLLVFKEMTPELLVKYKSKIGVSTMKKGLSVISITYTVSKMINADYNVKTENVILSICKKAKNRQKTNLKIIFRDLKSLIPFGSLEQNCQKYNIAVSKLIFPYSFLKSKDFLTSVTVENIRNYQDLFYDTLAGKQMSDDKITEFILQFKASNCCNLFGYLKIYLLQDLKLLNLLFNKTVDSFIEEDINFILTQKLTISSIAYYHIFIHENFKNPHYNALHKTSSRLITQFLTQSIIGGYTCCNTSGSIDNNFIINQEFAESNCNPDVWPSLKKGLTYNNPVKKITSYDIISLYPSAMAQGNFSHFYLK